MFESIVIALIIWAFTQPTQAQEFMVHGKLVTKLEAIRTMVREPDTKVYKCQQIELTEKATVKPVKGPRSVSQVPQTLPAKVVKR